ncbi:hypothetical protein N7539_002354 [Penicillium diatomitis]|uniref:Uncharacterized protein n=1 Tax=Penicillium diatomitis TaxID=2819901 RepID=A0A9W9XEP5_9EURO|nr:uncharacterized protein N7539_002354 [Penicillium diatomitis]KAJ5490787.1 hypothetical protein N7539_002354 [Penicillium diatomitis]
MAWQSQRSSLGVPRSPSVTLEVAYSGSDAELDSDVRFWLRPGDGETNVCLTPQINRSQPEIRIAWKGEKLNGRRYRTRHILITKRRNHIEVNSDALIIPFEGLFRRPPSCPREQSQEELKAAAKRISHAQIR